MHSPVVVVLNVLPHELSEICLGRAPRPVDDFGLEGVEERFHMGVLLRSALRRALPQAQGPETVTKCSRRVLLGLNRSLQQGVGASIVVGRSRLRQGSAS